jgi:phosphatidylglycerol:prolipoprotein diacylglycerol transferase
LYLIFYGIIRFFVSFFRADDLMMGMFRAPHVASFVMIIAGLIIIAVKRRSA